MEKKPNQVIDEITNVIYPPAEAVVSQLTTIRAIIPSTIKMYESTGDIHTIQPNLDMIQRAVDYLRGAPMRDELKPPEKNKLLPVIKSMNPNVTVGSFSDGNDEYEISITGNGSLEPTPPDSELFGELNEPVLQVNLTLNLTCGKSYKIVQHNPALEYFPNDDRIIQCDNGDYAKAADYHVEDDTFTYSFLIKKGRSIISIAIIDNENLSTVGYFTIHAHIHFKEQEAEDNGTE